MAQPSNSLFRRIRSVKSSLDNAEQSFLDNKDIRGELDLMLAEAELKNLRKQKDRLWSWNRQLLAGSIALLLVLAGVGGWYFARGHYKSQSAEMPLPANAVVKISPKEPVHEQLSNTASSLQQQQEQKQEKSAPYSPEKKGQVSISKADLHKLVQSARVELSNSK